MPRRAKKVHFSALCGAANSKTVGRIIAATQIAKECGEEESPEERAETFANLISAIRDEPEDLALAEDKPLEYLACYVNQQCRSGDAIR